MKLVVLFSSLFLFSSGADFTEVVASPLANPRAQAEGNERPETDVRIAQTDTTPLQDIGEIPLVVVPGGTTGIQVAIAIPDAMNLGTSDPTGAAAVISRTLRRDLELAGYFQVITPASFFFDQHADGMTAATVNFENWYNAGATGVAKTAFRVAGGQIRLDMRLFDVDASAEIDLSLESATVSGDEIEAQVHEFANRILEYYSGYRGPFGSTIAFVGRGEGGSREIYTMTVGGDGMGAVTSNRSINILPQWAGGSVVYTTYVHGNPDLAIGGGASPRIISSRSGLNTGGALSPDGSAMAVALTMDGNSEIYLISPEDGSIISRLTNNRAEDVTPVWSPSGSQIAFVSDRSSGPQIYIMDRDGAGQRRVTFAGSYNTTPDWSPDGTRIAFTGRDSRNRFDIFTVDVGTSHIERLTQDQGNNETPSWSPDGQYVVFSSTRGGGDSRLYVMTQDGNFQTLLTRDGSGYSMPAWRR